MSMIKAEAERIATKICDKYFFICGRNRHDLIAIIMSILSPPAKLEWTFNDEGRWETHGNRYRIAVNGAGSFVLYEKNGHNHGWNFVSGQPTLAAAQEAANAH